VTGADVVALLPLILPALAAVAIMVMVAFRRRHRPALWVALAGFALAWLSVLLATPAGASVQVTPLLVVDGYARFFMGLLLATAFAVAVLAYGYLDKRPGNSEEFYIMLLLATVGAEVLAASRHFATFFLGLELLTVSLYVLIAYLRTDALSVEAGIKYLVLAAVSSAFLLFGMALIYAQAGTLEFARMATSLDPRNVLALSGLGMLVVGVGFKLAVVPFHMWTPDVYEGAPAPVTGFIATVSKGGMAALLLRYFLDVDIHAFGSLIVAISVISIASMLAGNLLALLQTNVKRILAYSSIAHLGYLLVAFVASGGNAAPAVMFYLVAYFVTILTAFGVVTVLSGPDREADALDDYRGLYWRRPWEAAVMTGALLSLAGIPLTAGFVGKFYILAAGVGSALWVLVITLVVGSAISLYYYLRIVVAMYLQPLVGPEPLRPMPAPAVPAAGGAVLAILTLLLVWLGVYPAPLLSVIQAAVAGLG
jgi:NADH-quinone oxidoreductase subunit N